LNLFRDQLDRYGEVNTIAKKWKDALKHLDGKTTLILNADDPQVALLGEKLKAKVLYFGIDPTGNENDKFQHASDSTYCPNCKTKLTYSSVYFSHLGNWNCQNCNYGHPKKVFTESPLYPLAGIYNEYNINAAVLLAKNLRLSDERISSALKNFKPAFGRQEILTVNSKQVQIFLSKNPTGLNESLKTIVDLKAENLLLVLNDRIPDGRDVSWIWDVDFENYATVFKNIMISGDRVFDMGLRLKYAGFKNFRTEENLTKAVNIALEKTAKNEILYILPTYSAMLEVRKILTGKKIL
jgi:UDP-N-acetylmuramyl tripeptide synthase